MKYAVSSFTATLAAACLLAATPILAADPPQFEDGPPIYKVNGANLTNANCGDTLTFAVHIHNVNNDGTAADFSELQNVVAKATLPSGTLSSHFTSNLTLSASNAPSVSESVTVNVPNGSSVELASGPVGITQGGASLGHVRKKLETSFTAKVTCPAPTAVVTPSPPPGRGGAPAPVAVAKPQPLAQTGPEDGLLLGALLTSLLVLTWILTRPQKRGIPVKK
jgi:uncharacterized repeat protein (TIGR01451 family)